MDVDMREDLLRHVNDSLTDPGIEEPPAWSSTRAVFIPQYTSAELDAHRLVVAPLVAWTSRSLLYEYEAQLRPRWPCAEGLVRGGTADAHALTAQVVAQKTSEWGARAWFLTADLSGGCGSIPPPPPLIRKVLERRVGAAAAQAI